jgi:hypothetical protein
MNLHPRICDYARDLGLELGANGRPCVMRDLGQKRLLVLAGAAGADCPESLSSPARVSLWFDGTRQRGIALTFTTAREAMRFMAGARIDFVNRRDGK